KWTLPNKYEEAKSLIYALYKTISESRKESHRIPGRLSSNINPGNTNDTIYSFNQQFLGYFEKVLQDIINANPELEGDSIEKVEGNTVFIIHGHDNGLKNEVKLLLTRVGVNNIVLHEQPDKGRNIIDKIVEESYTSNYAIALLSPDDILNDGSKRSRQNVILEAGYFIGRLGKERVRLLKKGDIEIPSDLQGIL